MTHGSDGRPQVYKATSSTKTGPGGIRETQKTVQDSRTGVKKMAIGHHIGERAHVIEREQNVRTGHEEERQGKSALVITSRIRLLKDQFSS